MQEGNLSGAIPLGWTASSPRNGGDSSSAITLSEGDSLRIVFRIVDLDPAAAAYFSKHGLADLASLTRTLHDSTAGTGRGGIDRFSLGGRDCAAYEVKTGGERTRVVVFMAGGRYFECEAGAVGRGVGAATYKRLFSAQQTVLRSVR